MRLLLTPRIFQYPSFIGTLLRFSDGSLDIVSSSVLKNLHACALNGHADAKLTWRFGFVRVHRPDLLFRFPAVPYIVSHNFSSREIVFKSSSDERRKHIDEVWGRQDVGIYKQNNRLVQEPLLEGGDGAHSGGSAELRKDHVRQRHSCELTDMTPNKAPTPPLYSHWQYLSAISMCLCMHDR